MDIRDWSITDAYGAVDKWHTRPHRGVDFAAPVNSPLPSIGDGYVTAVSDEGAHSFGRSITVHLRDGYDVIYGHLSKQIVTVGQHVKPGQIIGYTGSTGDSTGPHLHLQIMRGELAIDPLRYLGDNAAPWWDINAHSLAALDGVKDWWESGLLYAATHTVALVLPSLALIGILWWIIPFAPKQQRGLKLSGFSLLLYLFYRLWMEAYA